MAGGAGLEPAARKYIVPKILIIFLIIKARAQARAYPPGSNTTSLTFHEPNRLVNITTALPENSSLPSRS
jgi:hypothetical protein